MESLSSAIRNSDRKPAQILGVTLTRDYRVKTRPSFIATLKRRFKRKHLRMDEEQDLVVWDVPNPFAPPDPDPDLARIHAFLQLEIARMRRGESIGPLDDDPETDSDSDSDYSYPEDGDEANADKLAPIVLPRLLPIPLRFLPVDDGSPSTTSDVDHWPDLAQAYDDMVDAEAEEHARKAKRAAHRSRAKAIAILGPEASAVL